ncbi:unnamed protein product [Orchesella dallaii]|uniref:Uncharacterized protein n=1 Tax=Orchesella dallaii TaxID=48710 RepID=A0ABP1PUY0_9HEXA
MKIFITLLLGFGAVQGQFGVPPFSWGGGNRPPGPNGYGKPPGPGRPGPPGGYNRPDGPGGPPVGYPPRGDGPVGNPYSDDPVPPHPESSYDPQRLPSKLPIEAPNGVVEIYNRVVDDLIGILKTDFKRRDLDPMPVVIRSTPPGPVRVPGYLQKRPFRRPGAALYRSSVSSSGIDVLKLPSSQKYSPPKIKRTRRAASGESRFGDNRPAVEGVNRGLGKLNKGPIEDDEKEILETTPSSSTPAPTSTTAAPEVSSTTTTEAAAEENENINVSISQERSSEEDPFMKARSDEFFPDTEDEEMESRERKDVTKKKGSESEEEPEEEGKIEDEKEVESLMQMYHSQNSKDKGKYSGKKKKDKEANKPVVVDPAASEEEPEGETEAEVETETEIDAEPPKATEKKDVGSGEKSLKSGIIQSEESEDDEDDDDDPEGRDDQPDDEFSAEPGTGGGQRPNGGYYPSGGPPAVPAKPNAILTGLSNIKRVTDVQVSVDARSAVITSRLLVGPIEVVINDSSEPMEKNVKARIPELEAELLLMERHGVVFLQRFTLDRAYGQDVEISVPKSKKEKKGSKGPGGLPPPQDPNHPINVEARRQTKMAAHISMEVVKLLRSGNLRANLMRTATSAMSKLKLPIKKTKSKKKSKKDKAKKESKE